MYVITRAFQLYAFKNHIGIVLFVALSCLSASLVFWGPHTSVDSKQYFLMAKLLASHDTAFIDNSFARFPGYPIFLSLVTDPINSAEAMQPVLYYHFFFCIMIDCLVLLITRAITGNLNVAIFSGISSALMVEKSIYGGLIKEEIMFAAFSFLAIYLFVMAIQRRNILLYFLGVIVFALAGTIRASLHIFITIPCFLFIYHNYQNYILSHSARIVRFMTVMFILVSFAIVMLPAIYFTGKSFGFHEKLSILWARTIQFQPHNRAKKLLMKIDPKYFDDYETWMAKRGKPEGWEYDALWAGDNPWSYMQRQQWWKLKMPQWVLMAERGMSRSEAMRWQADVSLQMIADNYPSISITLLHDYGNAFTNEVVAWYKFSETIIASWFTKNGFSKEQYRMFIMIHHRISKILKIVALLGVICGFFIYRTPEYWLVALLAIGLPVFNITFGGAGHARYSLQFLPFAGFFIYCAYSMLHRQYRLWFVVRNY